MLEWIKRRRAATYDEPEPEVEASADRRSVMSGKYRGLYKFLDTRYADRVVLRFGEIEDILGFPLPGAARLSEEWWTSPDWDAAEPRFSDSWTLAHRSARPNLGALTVVFDRVR